MAEEISIEFTRFSAFYSPLIATMAGGFLKEQGLKGKHSVSAPGKSAIAGLLDGSVHVGQSAPSQGFGPLEQGKQPPALHFAQINEKDGFFLAAQRPDTAFSWSKLKGKKVIVDHGGQPLAMFKYACFKQGLDFSEILPVDAGSTERMLAAKREWLATDAAKAFMRAYRKARAWLIATPAAQVAEAEAPFFKDIDRSVL